MSSCLRFLLTLSFLLFPLGSPAQVPTDTSTVDEALESALDNLRIEQMPSTQLAEQLAELAAHPLDLNTAPASALALIPAFTPLVAQRIVRYRRQHGFFHAWADLSMVAGMTPEMRRTARPFLIIGPSPSSRPQRYPAPPALRTILHNLQSTIFQRVTRRLDLPRGYQPSSPSSAFLGSPLNLYTRFRIRYRRRVSINVTLEKDPGEPLRWHPASATYGFDHVTGHAALRNFGRVKTLILGDFIPEFGQGLTLWRGLSFGKGRNPIRAPIREGRGLIPYGSATENQFFRGLAGTFMLTPRVSVSAFLSHRHLDATIAETYMGNAGTPRAEQTVTSTSSDGLHRTPKELARKDALRERVAGGGLAYDGNVFHLGITGYRSVYDPPLASGQRPYERFDFSGRRAAMASLYADVFLDAIHVFGEVGRAPSGTWGGSGGLTVDLSPAAQAVVSGRVFPRTFDSIYGHAFGERSGTTQNEIGTYVGLQFKPSAPWRLSAYVDQYRFPWLRFAVPRPSTGSEVRLVAEHRPRPWLSYYVQLRSETRERGTEATSPSGALLNAVHRETRQSIRWHGRYTFSKRLRLSAQLEGVRALTPERPPQYGVHLYQDVRWRPFDGVQLDARLAFFDTDGFATRVYAYEHDLLYAFAIPAFSGQGQRTYVLMKLTPLRALTLQAKYGVTRFQHIRTIGSGLDEIETDRLREVRIQMRWSF